MAISLMEAYIIETLKVHPYTYKEVVGYLQHGDLEIFSKDYDYDFTLLQKLYTTDETEFKAAYTERYTVKYVTINGLIGLLRMRFGIVDGFTKHETSVSGIEVNAEVEEAIRFMLSSNWNVTREGNTITISA
ncbi:hypothetical protein CSE16_09445 [Solibacillus sp. R5-41]|uniref:hypothetical protein n=1 Tax=Solibacillus sp. R5-41 TaxID=2048654 RepID=UPI000C128C55|nr:hypothetical protein [Solibacillus sp. R5-41]ATP40249.1 hypothetical protein CSE16_09445 [Solibacillus sp. R5-41]